MARCVSGSASLKPSIVLSENTTPQPNVASARFRSMTVISHDGLVFFARMEKYNPAGPPPKHATLMPPPAVWPRPICCRCHLPAQPHGVAANAVLHRPSHEVPGEYPLVLHSSF